MADYDAYVIGDFVPGKKTRRGEPLAPNEAPEPRTVVAVPPSRARRFFRARDDRELREHLRALRDRGLLLTSKGRGLRQNVRTLVRGSGVDRTIVKAVREEAVRGGIAEETVRRAPKPKPTGRRAVDLSEDLAAVRARPGITTGEFAVGRGVSRSTAERRIRGLVRLGLVVGSGSGRRNDPVTYEAVSSSEAAA